METTETAPTNTSAISNEMTPIGTFFTNTFTTFKQGLPNFLILFVIRFIMSALIVGSIFFTILSMLSINLISLASQKSVDWQQIANTLNTPRTITFVLIVAAIILIGALIEKIISLASFKIYDNPKNASIGNSLGAGLKAFFPVLVVELLCCWLIMGGYWLFFIPGLMMSILLCFTTFEIIIGNKSLLAAMKGSYAIASQNLGGIIARALIIFGANMCISLLFQIILLINKEAKVGVTIVSSIVSLLFGMYAIPFAVELYKDAKQHTDWNKKNSMMWMIIVSIIGWIICGFVALVSVTLIKTMWSKIANKIESNKTEQSTNKNEFFQASSYVPSMCGFSMPVPETTDTYQGKVRRWQFDEVKSNNNKNFGLINADNDASPMAISSLYYAFDNGATERNAGAGVDVYCINNTRSLNDEEYMSLIKTNKNIRVIESKQLSLEDTIVNKLMIENTTSKQPAKEMVYAGVTPDKSKLYYISIFMNTDKSFDTVFSQISSDTMKIVGGLKFRQAE